ncbi:ComEA family DNA-binding protein [Microbulbifer aggregans]|uniref:ComEA family DNA-binding protein n=1 Tax=Microbulbifer aggregans TaxID=1769779 RepID=UPI001CFE983A|nr:helix-hairpin-helix domain-containing protein [Microbulbifer aggregans]
MKVSQKTLAVLITFFCLLGGAQLTFAEEAADTVAAEAVMVVNVNSASAEELSDHLIGIGPARAELIVEYREQIGGFTAVEQLLDVKGIGLATLEKNKDRIQL